MKYTKIHKPKVKIMFSNNTYYVKLFSFKYETQSHTIWIIAMILAYIIGIIYLIFLGYHIIWLLGPSFSFPPKQIADVICLVIIGHAFNHVIFFLQKQMIIQSQ